MPCCLIVEYRSLRSTPAFELFMLFALACVWCGKQRLSLPTVCSFIYILLSTLSNLRNGRILNVCNSQYIAPLNFWFLTKCIVFLNHLAMSLDTFNVIH